MSLRFSKLLVLSAALGAAAAFGYQYAMQKDAQPKKAGGAGNSEDTEGRNYVPLNREIQAAAEEAKEKIENIFDAAKDSTESFFENSGVKDAFDNAAKSAEDLYKDSGAKDVFDSAAQSVDEFLEKSGAKDVFNAAKDSTLIFSILL